MTDQLGKVPSKASKECFFKGSGRAVLNIFGYEEWKYFFMCNGREMTDTEIGEIEASLDFENFSVEGTITVEWPDISLEFNMNKLLGRKKGEEQLILSVSQNFFKMMQPFTVYKEWFHANNGKDIKKIDGYEWMFEQNKDDFSYLGHIRRGKEMFVTFEFGPDRSFHKLRVK